MRWVHFDDMAWPLPEDGEEPSLNLRLRYGTSIVMEDRLCAATVLSAYESLILAPRKKREHVIREIRRAMAGRPPATREEPAS